MITPPIVRRHTAQRYRLEAAKCKKCGKVFFPPRLICDACKAREFETVTLPNEGKVVTFTVIRTAPTGFGDLAPYCNAVVELTDGTRIHCQIADRDLVQDVEKEMPTIGMPVMLEMRRVQEDGESGVLAYAYKAVPDR